MMIRWLLERKVHPANWEYYSTHLAFWALVIAVWIEALT